MTRRNRPPLRLAALLTAAWFAVSASSCQTTIRSENAAFRGSGAAAVAGAVVLGSLFCLSDIEGCFGDRPEHLESAGLPADPEERAALVAAIRARNMNDPRAESWLCRSAQQGHAKAQYLYGAHLLGREDPAGRAEGLAWLRAARDQGHPEAQIVIGHALAKTPAIGDVPVLLSDDCPDPGLTIS